MNQVLQRGISGARLNDNFLTGNEVSNDRDFRRHQRDPRGSLYYTVVRIPKQAILAGAYASSKAPLMIPYFFFGAGPTFLPSFFISSSNRLRAFFQAPSESGTPHSPLPLQAFSPGCSPQPPWPLQAFSA